MAYNMNLRVRNLIKKAGSSNVDDIADLLGVYIREVEMPSTVNGFWKRILRRKFVFVNKDLTDWQRDAVVAHELGHIILHPKYGHFCSKGRCYYSSEKIENEADCFSVTLLSYSTEVEPIYVDYFLKNGWKKKKQTF